MGNELMIQNGGTLEPSQLFTTTKPLGMEGLSDRDLGLELGRLRLVHAIRSRNDIGRPGQWKLGTQLFDMVPIVVLKGHHYRVLVEGPSRDKQRTVCASADNIVPHEGVPEPKAERCGTCPYGQWRDGADGRRKPPPCADGIALLALILAPAPGSPIPVQPAWITCSKTARQAATDFGRAMAARGVQTFADYAVTLTSAEKRNEGVVWYEPVFTIGERIEGFRSVAQFAVENQLHYTPFVAGGSSETQGDQTIPDADPWDVPV